MSINVGSPVVETDPKAAGATRQHCTAADQLRDGPCDDVTCVRTVLCVDDEPNILRSLKRLLRRERYQVLTANSGPEALEILAREAVQVVMTDQRMPDMTGTELLARVQQIDPKIVRVVLSGYADAATIVEAINEGHIFRFMSKPWSDDDLKANLRVCFEQHELLSRNQQLTFELSRRNAELERVTTQLEQIVTERTKSLQLAQDAILNIPLPLFGISSGGMIALVNRPCEELFQPGTVLAVGSPMQCVLPADFAAVVKAQLEDVASTQTKVAVQVGPLKWHATVITLRNQGETRGCLVTLER